MSRDDLLADLQGVRALRPAAPPSPPPAHVPPPGRTPTPALDLSLTPLRWSLLRVGPARRGAGLSVRFGPVHVSLALR